jgi:predicted dehydrogenase
MRPEVRAVTRVAVVGLGNAAIKLHLPAFAGIAGARVVGGCDPDAARRTLAADRFRIPVFEDFEQLLAAASPDVVVIGTPPDSHFAYCLRSFAAGAHVLCEKPFVSSVDEANEVLAAARAAGKRIALNHEFREMPIFRAVRDEVARLSPGGPVFTQVWQLMDLPPWAEQGWRGQMLQRTLFEAGIHLVDFLLALYGETPVSVQASVSACGVREGDSDAVAIVTMEFSRGRLATIVQNRLCKGDTEYFEVRSETPGASIRASYGGRARLTAGLFRSTKPHFRIDFGASGLAWRETGPTRTPLARNPKDPGMLATRFVFEKSLAAFRSGDAPPVSGEDGRRVLEVIGACYRSAATGRRLAMNSPEVKALASVRMGAAPSPVQAKLDHVV